MDCRHVTISVAETRHHNGPHCHQAAGHQNLWNLTETTKEQTERKMCFYNNNIEQTWEVFCYGWVTFGCL